LRQLANTGVDVENGGHGPWYDRAGKRVEPTLWTRAMADASAGASLARLIGQPVKLLVPGRRVNGFDMLDTAKAHETLVVAKVDISAAATRADAGIGHPTARQILLINGLKASPGELDRLLRTLARRIQQAQLLPAPLSSLQ
jgi:hypothetical protein